MVEYNTINAALSDSQLNKLKCAVKNNEGRTLRMSARILSANNLPHELLLTTRQTTKLRNAIENNTATDIKLSTAQIYNIIKSVGFLGKYLGPLLKSGLSLLKSVVKPLGLLGLTAASSAIDASAQKKILGSVRLSDSALQTTTLIISNEEMNDIMKIVQAVEHSDILLKGITELIKNGVKEQKGAFFSMLLGPLRASLLENLLIVKGTVRTGEGFLRAGEGIKKIFNAASSFNKF